MAPLTLRDDSGAQVVQPGDLAELRRRSVRGGAITFISQAASVFVGLVSSVVLARLLSPDDYGIVAMVAAVTSFARLFKDLGLSSATIQAHTLTRAQQTNLFWINVALGAALTLALSAISPLVSLFYGRTELRWATVALSTTFLISSLATQSGALLVRQMRFGRQAAAGVAGSVLSVVTAVVLALAGTGYWSLVSGQLVGALTSSGLLFLLSPFRPGLPQRRTGVWEMIRFGANVTAFDFVNYFHRNLDNVLIGRYWGAGPLGIYSRAYDLLMFPITNLRGPINAVAFPALSRLQDQPAAFRAYYLRVTSLLALLSMPLTAYLFVAARPLIELLLGRRWLGVAPVFAWLALAAFIQPASGFVGSLLLSLGRGRRYFHCGLVNAIVLSGSFVVGLPWGPVGVALSYAVANYLLLYPWLTWAFYDSPVSFADFARACAFPAAVSATAVVLVWLSKPLLDDYTTLTQLVLSSLIFATGVLSTAAMTRAGRREVTGLANLLGELRSGFSRN